MPYKSSGKTVLIKRGKRWVPFKQHENAGQARAHAQALNINVKHRPKRRK